MSYERVKSFINRWTITKILIAFFTDTQLKAYGNSLRKLKFPQVLLLHLKIKHFFPPNPKPFVFLKPLT